jgi:hydroxylamine dehydrogenase
MKCRHLSKSLLMLVSAFVAGFCLTQTLMAKEDECETCHKKENPGLYMQWANSSHNLEGGVSCIDCHGAKKADLDAFEHYGKLIATLVTPKDCAECHEEEAEQTMKSYHSHAGEILQSKDAFLAHVAGGEPVVITGCEGCHGGKVEIDPSSPNKLSKKSWPNSGIGRINPDGSKGACNACHSRHSFSSEQARRPENCGKCHLGPDHPQKEIYEESKHGIAYRAHKDEMNMDKDEWVVGKDYYQAPTCSTCHMSATKKQGITHDVGDRISWTLRPPVSKRKDNWAKKKGAMKDVCSACHQDTFIEGHYYQYEATVRLYNEKFGKPATEIYALIKKKGLMKGKAAFSNDLDWYYWELWHHEGRRTRMGAAMMAPDYTWWHGMYDVAHNFYFKFLPKAKEYNDKDVNALIDKLLKDDPMHTWIGKSTPELKDSIRSGELQKIYEKMFEDVKPAK